MPLSLSIVRDSSLKVIRNEGNDWYQNFRKQNSCFSNFKDIENFISFLNDNRVQSKETYLLRDSILKTLITEFQNNRHTLLLRSIFLVVFYPLLSHLTYHSSNKNLGYEEVLGETVSALLKVINTFKISPKGGYVAKTISRNTKRQLKYWIDVELFHKNFEELDKESNEENSTQDNVSFCSEEILAYFQHFKAKGVINDLEEYLILGTKLYQQQLKKLVISDQEKLGGIGYEAAKKRIQRAEKRIKNYLKNKMLKVKD